MYTNEILEEKYRVQKKLSEEAKDIDDYIQKLNEAGKQIMEQYGFKFESDEPVYVPVQSIPKGIPKNKRHLKKLCRRKAANPTAVSFQASRSLVSG